MAKEKHLQMLQMNLSIILKKRQKNFKNGQLPIFENFKREQSNMDRLQKTAAQTAEQGSRQSKTFRPRPGQEPKYNLK